MKNLLPIISLIATLAGGCATYSTTNAGGQMTIDIENTGWYLFNYIPIASGDPDEPNQSGCLMFTDSVTLENNMSMLRQAMMETGTYKAQNIVSHTTDEKVFLILLKRYAFHTSAELIR